MEKVWPALGKQIPMALKSAFKISFLACLIIFFGFSPSGYAASPDTGSKKTESKSKSALQKNNKNKIKTKDKKAKPKAKAKKINPVTTIFTSIRHKNKLILTRIEQKVETLKKAASVVPKKAKKSFSKRHHSRKLKNNKTGNRVSFPQLYLSQSRQRFYSYPPSENRGNDFGPRVSPDGKLVAFFSDRSGAVNLWLMNIDGSQQRNITHSDVDILKYDPNLTGRLSFAPDSKHPKLENKKNTHLAFVMLNQLWKYNLIQDNLSTLSSADNVSAVDWSADGQWLLYVSGNSIRQIKASGGNDHLVVSDTAGWAHVALNKNPKANVKNFLYVGKGIYQGNTKTLIKKLLASSNVVPNQPSYSPDGKTIIYLAESPDFKKEVFLLTIQKKAAGTPEQITRGGAAFPFFSPSGSSLFFIRNKNLWVIRVDGSSPRVLTHFETVLPTVAEIPPFKALP